MKSLAFKALQVLLLSLSLATSASAALRDRGPVDFPPNLPLEFRDGHGYPKWYRDTTGLTLQPCLNDPSSLTADMCLPWAIEPTGYPNNHGAEMFYMAADAVDAAGRAGLAGFGVKGGLTLALEGAYSLGDLNLSRGDEMVFGRVRIRISINDPVEGPINANIPAQGTYRVIHPYGVEVFDNVGHGRWVINFTADVGITPLAFDDALQSQIGPFLTWDTYPDDPSLKFTVGNTVEEYVGNPTIPHRVKGSPFGTNVFRIEGPPGCGIGLDANGQPVDFIEGDLFALSGKKWLKPIPVKTSVNRATYSRDAASSQVTVWAAADITVPNKPMPQLVFGGTGLPPAVDMTHEANGRFYGNVKLGPDAPLPSSIKLTNLADTPLPPPLTCLPEERDAQGNCPCLGLPVSPCTAFIEAHVADLVSATAEYDTTLGILRVTAQSSDRTAGAPALRVLNFDPGIMTPNPAVPGLASMTASVAIPPISVSVQSTAGGTATVPVTPVSDPPVALPDVFASYENAPVQTLPVFANDGVVAPATLAQLRIIQTPLSGGTAIAVGQGVEYRPGPNFYGTDAFAYVVVDSKGLVSSTAVVTVDVARNQPPAANPDAATTLSGAPVAVDVLANDSDPDGDAIVVTAAGPASSGTTAMAGTAILYTPNAEFAGTDSFTYTIRDSRGATATGTATVTVQKPKATGVTLTPDLASPQLFGTPVVLTASGQGSFGYQYRFYVKNPNSTAYNLVQDWGAGSTWPLPSSLGAGTYRFVVHVRTSTTGNLDAQTGINYVLSSTPPVPPATGVTITSGQPSPHVAGTPVVFSASGQGSSGYQYRFFIKNPNSTTYQLVQDWGVGATWPLPGSTPAGTYRIVVHVRTSVTAAGAFDAQAGINYTLTQATPPTAVADTFTVEQGAAAQSLAVFANDAVVAPATFAELRIIQAPANGTATAVAQAISYRPAAGFSGTDTFTYVVVDSNGQVSSATTVTVTVQLPPNTAPVAQADQASTPFGSAVTIAVLANDSDADAGDTLTVTAVGTPTSGTATIAGSSVVYAPNAGFSGTDSFDYTIADSRGATATATVTVTVDAPPVAGL